MEGGQVGAFGDEEDGGDGHRLRTAVVGGKGGEGERKGEEGGGRERVVVTAGDVAPLLHSPVSFGSYGSSTRPPPPPLPSSPFPHPASLIPLPSPPSSTRLRPSHPTDGRGEERLGERGDEGG